MQQVFFWRKKLRVGITFLRTEDSVTACSGSPLANEQLELTLTRGRKVIGHSKTLSEETPFAQFDQLDPQGEYHFIVRPRSILKRFLVRDSRRPIPAPKAGPLRGLVISTGRCGTTSVTDYLNGLRFADGERVNARHETLAYRIYKAIKDRDSETPQRIMAALPHNLEVTSSYMALLPDAIKARKIAMLIRDGRDVVASGLAWGWFTNEAMWTQALHELSQKGVLAKDGSFKPHFSGDPFQKSCQLWASVTEALEPHAERVFRLEDLVRSSAERAALVAFFEIEPTERPFEKKNPRKSPVVQNRKTWSPEQRETFARICGRSMDRFYPGWQQTYDD